MKIKVEKEIEVKVEKHITMTGKQSGYLEQYNEEAMRCPEPDCSGFHEGGTHVVYKKDLGKIKSVPKAKLKCFQCGCEWEVPYPEWIFEDKSEEKEK